MKIKDSMYNICKENTRHEKENFSQILAAKCVCLLETQYLSIQDVLTVKGIACITG